jgi:hypothetical protein
MITTLTVPLVALGLVLSTVSLQAQGQPRYRDFELGSDLLSVSALTKGAASEVKTVHARPALIQELEWRPPYFMNASSTPQTDPVQQVVFSFYNDQLFKLVINYDRRRTDGMTGADLIEALSTTYGPPLKPVAKARAVVAQFEQEFGTSLAEWAGVDYSVALHQSSYVSAFRVIVTSPRLEALARTAGVQALRLDEREAPEREIARQKKEAEDARASQEKARLANKAVFRP